MIPLMQDDPPADDWDGLIGSPIVTVLEESLPSFTPCSAENPSPVVPTSPD